MYIAEYPIITDEGDLPLLIKGIGRTDAQCPVMRENGLLSYQIMYVKGGKGSLNLYGKEFVLERGDACILPSNVPHSYCAISEEWATNWITFRGDNTFINALLATLGLANGEIVRFASLDTLDAHFSAMVGILHEKQPYCIFTCSAAIYETLIDMCKERRRHNAMSSVTEDAYVNAAIEFMDVHYNEDVFLEQLATHASCSPEYLCKVFRRKMGMRPFEYLARKRIAEAKQLLTKTTLPISQIGPMVGYSDNSYFGYVFKKHESITPSEFRGL